jgi:plastocyanin
MRRPTTVLTAILGLVLSAALAVSAFAATKTVAVKDNVFAPKNVTVKKGTTVRWVWKGSAPHNVKVTAGPAKFSSATRTSGSFSRKLAKAGTYKIVCTIHAPGMSMRLKVR